jgi:branched-chain amino acid transport system permease protein
MLAVVLPLAVQNDYYLQVIILGYIWAIAVYGMNIILGYTGLLSLGHAGFFGIGAYTTALLMLKLGWSFWPALLAAAVLSVVVGYVVGLVSLRTKGHYFAIFTMAVGVIIHLVIDRWNGLTGGQVGLINIPPPNPIGPIHFDNSAAKYYLVLAFLVAAIYVAHSLRRSLVGRTLLAIRHSEELAEALGIPVMKNKRLAFMMSTCFAGVAGGLFATYLGYLGPDVTGVDTTFNMLLYLLVGGIGSIAGPLLGSLVVAVLTQFLQALQDYQMLIFGPVLVLLIIFFPGGLAGIPRLFRRRRAPVSAPEFVVEQAAFEPPAGVKEGL